jgi:DNA-binding transcriptional MerR regulator
MTGPYLHTTDIAYAVGVHPNTVRQYEVWGLLPPIPRTPSGYRLFTEIHLDQMRLARTTMAYTLLGGDIRQASYAMIHQAAANDLGGALECAYQVLVLVQSERAQAEVAASLLERWAQGTVTDATIKPMRIGEVAKLLNVTSDMLRNWERNHLIKIPRNLKNGYRMYGANEIGRLRVIRVLRRSGYSMMAILRMMLQLDKGQREGLRLALDTPRPDEAIGYAADKWLSTLNNIEPRVMDAIAQLEMMLQKYAAQPPMIRGKSLHPGGRAIVFKQFAEILKDTLERIALVISNDQYRLCGTAAGFFQGVFQPVYGISLLGKTRQQVDDFAQAMQIYPQIQKPMWIESDYVYKATHLVRGVEVSIEVPGETYQVHRDEIEAISPWHFYTNMEVGSFLVPVEALESRLATEIALGRPRHYQPTIKHLQKYGADTDLLMRAMKAKALSQDTMAQIMLQIQPKT